MRATVDALNSRGARVESRRTSRAGHATELAAEAARSGNVDAIVVAGGDGSIREAAKGLLGTPVPLGFIPSGTGNVLAFELGLVRSPEAIADYLAAGVPRPITPSLANGEPFLLMTGVGFDASVVAMVDSFWKRRLGKAAFAMPTLRALFAPPAGGLHVRLDGEDLETGWLIATHASRYAGRMRLTRATGIFNGKLELVAFDTPTRLKRASQLANLATGRLEHATGVTRRICTRLEISSSQCMPTQIDGDLLGNTPLVIEPGNRQLLLIAPHAMP